MSEPVKPEAVLAAVELLKTDLNTKVDGLKTSLLEEVGKKIEDVKNLIPVATAAALQPIHRSVYGDRPTEFKHLASQDLTRLASQVNFILAARKSFVPGSEKAMGLTIGADGAFAVPDEFKAEILRKLYYISPIYRLSKRYSGVGMKGTINKAEGNVSLTWENEVASGDETVPATGLLGQIAWSLKKLSGLTFASNDLLQFQGIDMLNYLAELYAIAYQQELERVFTNGLGNDRPTGIRRYRAGAKTTARNAGARALWQDMRLAKHALGVQYRSGAVWQVPNAVIALLANAVDDNKRPLWREIGDSTVSGKMATLPEQTVGFFDGQPVLENNEIPLTMASGQDTGGTQTELIYSRLDYGYVVFESGAMEMAVSDQFRFGQDQLAIRVKAHVDAKPGQTEATSFLTGVETA